MIYGSIQEPPQSTKSLLRVPFILHLNIDVAISSIVSIGDLVLYYPLNKLLLEVE